MKNHSVVEKALRTISIEPISTLELSAELELSTKDTSQAVWQLKRFGYVKSTDGRHEITSSGTLALAAVINQGLSLTSYRRRNGESTPTPEKAPQRAPSAAKVPAVAAGANDRAAEARLLGAGLVESVRGSFDLLRAVIGDQIEGESELIEAALSQHARTIDLLVMGYRVAV